MAGSSFDLDDTLLSWNRQKTLKLTGAAGTLARQRWRAPVIANRLPEIVAAAVLEFCDAGFASNPHRVSKPVFELAGCHSARHGTYRIVYRIDEGSRVVHVRDIDHLSIWAMTVRSGWSEPGQLSQRETRQDGVDRLR